MDKGNSHIYPLKFKEYLGTIGALDAKAQIRNGNKK